MKTVNDADMREYTSFKAGGKADRLVMPETMNELSEALSDAKRSGSDFFILGNGTDVIVRDAGYRGTIIRIAEGFDDIEVDGRRITAGAGALLSRVARAARDAGLTGFEPLSGIPGSVGGAVFMNAGAYGGEIKDVIEEVTAIDPETGETSVIKAEGLDLSYRHSSIMDSGLVIVSAVFRLEEGDIGEIDGKMKDFTERRNSKQPLNYPSAGSFFKRPEGYFAGKLISDAGLKGLSVGGAEISEKHAGFMINKGGATATDIIRLMRLVQNTVNDKFGVMLEPEVRIIGEEDI